MLRLDHVLRNGGLADIDPELQELAMDTGSAPEWVGHGYLTNQFSNFTRHRWSSRPSISALPSPVQPEPLLVPADDGLRLDDEEGSTPLRPDAAEDIPEGSISPAKGWSGRIALKDLDLVTEGCILQDQGSARSEN